MCKLEDVVADWETGFLDCSKLRWMVLETGIPGGVGSRAHCYNVVLNGYR